MAALDSCWCRRRFDPVAIASTPFEAGFSSNPQSIFSQPVSYNSSICGYDCGFGHAGSDVPFVQNVSPQQIFGPQFWNKREYCHGTFNADSPGARPIKLESDEVVSTGNEPHVGSTQDVQYPATPHPDDVVTDVDTLMKAIQTHAANPVWEKQSCGLKEASTRSPNENVGLLATESTDVADSSPRRRYPCRIDSCTKVFTQKTHLEIHMRAHTGQKPYVRHPPFIPSQGLRPADIHATQLCREASCAKRFSQLGNLKVAPYVLAGYPGANVITDA
ncbi:DNA-binding transcription factor [Lecanora helva]